MTVSEQMMVVCNSCRYCEGFCAVFRAMEYRRQFPESVLNYLANLCHDCRECYYACQYAPPHPWEINPPPVFSRLRRHSYRKYAWPGPLAAAYDSNGFLVTAVLLVSLVVFLLGAAVFLGGGTLFQSVPKGDFYQVTPHLFLIAVFGVAALFSVTALAIGLVRFCRDCNERVVDLLKPAILGMTIKEVFRLDYLSNNGWGCTYPGEESSHLRRWFHHATFYGFLLCFAATTAAALYHFVGYAAPYGYFSLPVILGTLGGLGIIAGPAGLLFLKYKSDRDPADEDQWGMDTIFGVLLMLTGATGLLLLFLRETPAMGILLVIHLAMVMAFFLVIPYGKFVHGLYRFAAVAKYARERRLHRTIGV